ncbi:MAG: 2-C-methyl-D-erythritol 4-phosphate cytidylyltransferase [Ignavibacteria bacterium]|nr:2-C-methyl-D-erythritol 4-phosphate cytidylyltransferase [Ignavibacteria bacterium]
MEFFVIIPASGSGVRFGSDIPKQFLKYNNKEILLHTVEKFFLNKNIHSVFISIHPDYLQKKNFLDKLGSYSKPVLISRGGATRQESVYKSLRKIKCKNTDRIIIHDAVRPFLSRNLLDRIIEAAKTEDAVIPGIELHDTVKRIDKKGYVTETIKRETLRSIQTPQVFRYDKLMKAFEKAVKNKFTGTDEASIMEYAGYKVKIIDGESSNIKITTKKDLKNK